MRRSTLLAAASLLFAPAVLLAQDHEEKDHEGHMDATAAITAQSQAFNEGWNSGDWAAVAALYADDAVVMPPGSEAVTGRAAIEEMFATVGEGWGLELTTMEVFAVEGAALEVGSWVMTGPDGSHADHGNYMAAWTWTEDGWKMARDMWNSNMAPAGGE
jgi:uncharacterized protein (TIGR02246 family)